MEIPLVHNDVCVRKHESSTAIVVSGLVVHVVWHCAGYFKCKGREWSATDFNGLEVYYVRNRYEQIASDATGLIFLSITSSRKGPTESREGSDKGGKSLKKEH